MRGPVNWYQAGLLGLIFGFGLLTWGWVGYASSTAAMANAEPVAVTVIETDVEAGAAAPGDGYTVHVQYEYEHDGRTYRNDDIDPGVFERSFDSEADARAFLDDYQPGENATGYVNPERPGQSFLKKPPVARRAANEIGSVVAMLVGLPIALVGVYASLLGAAKLGR